MPETRIPDDDDDLPHTSPYRFRRLLKKVLPRTLFGRSLLIIVTPVILAQTMATWIFYDRHWETITKRLAFGVAGEITLAIGQLQNAPDPVSQSLTMALTERATDIQVRILPDTDLPEKDAPIEGTLPRILANALTQQARLPFHIKSNFMPEWYEIRVLVPGLSKDGTARVVQILSPERRLYSPTNFIFILWMIGSSLVLFTIAIVFMRNQIRPIRRLAIAADSLGKGRDVPHFKLEGATEVRQAAAAFLVMRARIQRQISQRTEMLAGVSHDLRTPLTRMKLQLALLGDGPDIEELRSDVTEMEGMIDGYLAFARGEGSEQVRPTDLGRLLFEVANNERRAGATVTLTTTPSMVLPLRASAFRRALVNLIANARRHASHVWVRAQQYPSMIEIVIDDDGPGIPAAHREDVFKPFFRLDTSRNPETGGAGLGLAVARDVVRGHGGEITLDDNPQGGLRAIIRIPI
ncbi:two-component system, OmpR family, osmolarity sensor histidine kinase EnvZ [Azospirillaceae bacterium]